MRTILFVLVTALLGPLGSSAGEVVAIGVASPRGVETEDTPGALRERAVNRALELAVLRVSGTLITSQKADALSSHESVTAVDDQMSRRLEQDHLFKRGVMSRSSGVARLVEILREWPENSSYHVEARIEVEEEVLAAELVDAGILWRRAGKPRLQLVRASVPEETGEQFLFDDAIRYLRENLVRNGIDLAGEDVDEVDYRVVVAVSARTEPFQQLGTYRAHCTLSYEVVDLAGGRTVAASRLRGGPKAGFDSTNAATACFEDVAPRTALDLVERLGRMLNDLWVNGRDYQLTLRDVPQARVGKIVSGIESMFRSNGVGGSNFSEGSLQMEARFRGSPSEMAQATLATLYSMGVPATLGAIEGSRVFITLDSVAGDAPWPADE